MERELVGGECQYRVCVPIKALLRPVVIVPDISRVEGGREAVNGPLDAAAEGCRGRARMVVDLVYCYLLGVTFVGLGIAELLHSATVAVAGQLSIDRLWHVVPCYPSISEVWLHLLEAYRS